MHVIFILNRLVCVSKFKLVVAVNKSVRKKYAKVAPLGVQPFKKSNHGFITVTIVYHSICSNHKFTMVIIIHFSTYCM